MRGGLIALQQARGRDGERERRGSGNRTSMSVFPIGTWQKQLDRAFWVIVATGQKALQV